MRRSWLVGTAFGVAFVLSQAGPGDTRPAADAARICTTRASNGVCGPYTYRRIVNSNGYNTYTDQDMWAAKPHTTQTLTSTGPGGWSVVSSAKPAGFTGVQTYPNVQQLFNDWTGHGWNGSGNATDTPIARLSSLVSFFTESMPHNSATDAEAAYDIWLSHVPRHDSNEVMIWVDNVNRGTGGAARIGRATLDGQRYTVLQYGGPGGELIFSLDRSEPSGMVNILGVLDWLVRHRYESATLRIGQIDFGWEICSETTPCSW
jgi:hypothetical protein